MSFNGDSGIVASNADVLAHYRTIAPLWLPRFGGTPLVALTYPHGFDGDPHFIAALHKDAQHEVPTVGVSSVSGDHRYAALSEATLEWFIARGAVEFHTWTPTPSNPLTTAFARILLTPQGRAFPRGRISVAALRILAEGHKRRPSIVQEEDGRFRIDHILDDWPDRTIPGVTLVRTLAPADVRLKVIDALRLTVHSEDTTAFEVAVCDAFALLGFATQHFGGEAAPDGIADAQLGVLG